ncbi:transposase, partial [Streptomyces sp. NPDC059766]|uniref:transposase n=1 Tax=Streptomyces sp. NPDC059766 TaxID=3346940 RepID=UPI00365D2202
MVVPELTARMARAGNPRGTTAMWGRDQLDGLWDDEDIVPGIRVMDVLSPAQLATVCVLQFLLNLSDRQPAEAVRCRIDFKYALAMDLGHPGFHHSVLTDFRDRLCQDDRADHLLSLALDRMRQAGLLKERRQRLRIVSRQGDGRAAGDLLAAPATARCKGPANATTNKPKAV